MVEYGRTAWTLSLTRFYLPQTSHNVLNYIIWHVASKDPTLSICGSFTWFPNN